MNANELQELVRYSGHGLNNEPLDERTVLDYWNTKLVRYSDPNCILVIFDIRPYVFFRSMVFFDLWFFRSSGFLFIRSLGQFFYHPVFYLFDPPDLV